MYRYTKFSLRHLALLLSVMLSPSTTLAQVFDGPGIDPPVIIDGPVNAPLRVVVLTLLYYVLSFLALAAVIVIIIAGIRLVISQGEEEAMNKAKKTILYTVIGLLVIFFARALVGFVLYGLPI